MVCKVSLPERQASVLSQRLVDKAPGGAGAPPRNTLSRNPHRALVRSHESEATACGNAQKPRFRGGAPTPPGARESTDFSGHHARKLEGGRSPPFEASPQGIGCTGQAGARTAITSLFSARLNS